jgi:hypothetical protein
LAFTPAQLLDHMAKNSASFAKIGQFPILGGLVSATLFGLF